MNMVSAFSGARARKLVLLPAGSAPFIQRRVEEVAGLGLVVLGAALILAFISYFPTDPSPLKVGPGPTRNLLGGFGAAVTDVGLQTLGLAHLLMIIIVLAWGWRLFAHRGLTKAWTRVSLLPVVLVVGALAFGALPNGLSVALPAGPGGVIGRLALDRFASLGPIVGGAGSGTVGLIAGAAAAGLTVWLLGFSLAEWRSIGLGTVSAASVAGRVAAAHAVSTGKLGGKLGGEAARAGLDMARRRVRREPRLDPQTPTERADPPVGTPPAAAAQAFSPAPTIAPTPAPTASPAREDAGYVPPPAPFAEMDDIDGWDLPIESFDAPEALPPFRRDGGPLTASASPTTMTSPTVAASPPSTAPGSIAEPTIVGFGDEPLEPETHPGHGSAFEAFSEPATARAPAPLSATPVSQAFVTLPTPTAAPIPVIHGAGHAPTLSAPPKRGPDPRQATFDLVPKDEYQLPPHDFMAKPPEGRGPAIDDEQARRNAEQLEGVLQDFGVRGEIMNVRPGPVVTLYELEPAPGTKSARVIGLADDIARSMSAVAVRIAVVPGRSVIGIELPNAKRETVYMREMLAAEAYGETQAKLALILGKDIGGAPVVVDLARMPHLLIAGTTGSGKSVGINTMILSLLYRLSPEKCRFIMIDPKMLELSVYDGIPHLLAPVVTDPKKAVVALKWVVREMETRYRKMSKEGVRNIEGYNARMIERQKSGSNGTRSVQIGFDEHSGAPLFAEQPLDDQPLHYIVVVIDEMADLMLVAGKEIEGAVQRLAQMARAAGIHLIMATQRPSVDVITGTIKANFPTRISFQVTSKIDSRTILGESGAEQLLGQGDMLYMAGGGRITRVHGPFVADHEVEAVVGFLKEQGAPDYVEAVTEEDEEPEAYDAEAAGSSGDDLYDQAVALIARERKASTSFIQRHLQIGYNRAARIIERMETEGVVSTPNHAGKREVLLPGREH